MGLFTLLGLKSATAASTKTADAIAPKATTWPQGAVVQLVGANLISNMFDQGYGIEKYLPKLFELGPNGKPPKPFKSIGGGDGKFYPNGRLHFDRDYIGELCLSFQFGFVLAHKKRRSNKQHGGDD